MREAHLLRAEKKRFLGRREILFQDSSTHRTEFRDLFRSRSTERFR